LTISDTSNPNWYPLPLFDVTDGRLPSDWGFVVRGEDVRSPVLALWGYSTLVNDPDHHDALIDRRMSALRKFLQECDRSGLADEDLRRIKSLDELAAEWRSGG
jgi:hypothetical protein